MITLVKFIRNRLSHTDNYLITRTLGKVGVVKKELFGVMDPRPRHDEFWFAEILSEVRPNESKGCWILRPIRPIGTVTRKGGFSEPDIVRLIPGTFDVERRGNTLYIYPHAANSEKGPNWILDVEVRRQLLHRFRAADGSFEVNSVIVVFDEKPAPELVVKPKSSTPTDPIIDFDAMAKELNSDT